MSPRCTQQARKRGRSDSLLEALQCYPGLHLYSEVLQPRGNGAARRVLSGTHNCRTIGELVDAGLLAAETGDEIGKAAYGTGDIPFVRTSDISNWEIKSAPKQGVSREIYAVYASDQDVQSGDILFVRDGTYLIGTNCFITEIDKEILYQSHVPEVAGSRQGSARPASAVPGTEQPLGSRTNPIRPVHGRHHRHHRPTLFRACSPSAQEQETTEDTDEGMHEGPRCEGGR